MHSIHPDIHEAGLQDNCLECEYEAQHPTQTLDSEMLRNLLEYATNRELVPRTHNEAVAVGKVLNDLEHVGRLFSQSPTLVRNYFEEKWGIKFWEIKF